MRLPAHLFCVSPANLSITARCDLPSMLELPVEIAIAHHLAPRYRWFLCDQARQPGRHPCKRRDRNQRRLPWSRGITPTSCRQIPTDPVVNPDSLNMFAAPERDRGNAEDS